MFSPFIDAALLIWGYMTLLFVIALWRRDNSIADIAWGVGFTLVAWWLHWKFSHSWSWLTSILISVWGLRLAIYIGFRNLRKGREDWRYANWRRDWGQWFVPRSYLQVFMLQGFFMWVISLPLMQRPGAEVFTWYQGIGVLIWGLGFFWEAIGDWQLSRFKANPNNKGKIMTKGLWSLSRHPNYFGEILLWWGVFLVVLPFGKWWLSLLSPITITWLLTRVSGVPMLEEKYKNNPDYQDYVKSTPPLIPRIRKNKNI